MNKIALFFFFIPCLALLPSCQKESTQATSSLESILQLSENEEEEFLEEHPSKAPRPKVVQLPSKR